MKEAGCNDMCNEIKAEALPNRDAQGWHCLGPASQYTKKPVALHCFGIRLVAYRGSNGKVNVLNAYCPHLGADLSQGFVEDNSIRCPLHHWRWSGDGVCDHIPYSNRIPASAVTKSWKTKEENSLLFVCDDREPPVEKG